MDWHKEESLNSYKVGKIGFFSRETRRHVIQVLEKGLGKLSVLPLSSKIWNVIKLRYFT